jgi:hypothetical protein
LAAAIGSYGPAESGCRIEQTQLRSGNDGSGWIGYNSMQGCRGNLRQQTCRHGKTNKQRANRRKVCVWRCDRWRWVIIMGTARILNWDARKS